MPEVPPVYRVCCAFCIDWANDLDEAIEMATLLGQSFNCPVEIYGDFDLAASYEPEEGEIVIYE